MGKDGCYFSSILFCIGFLLFEWEKSKMKYVLVSLTTCWNLIDDSYQGREEMRCDAHQIVLWDIYRIDFVSS